MKLVTSFLCFGGVLYIILVSWIVNTFPVTDAETVIFTLRMPIDGFVSFFVKDALLKTFVPASIISLVMYSICFFILKTGWVKKILFALLLVAILGQTVWVYEEIPIRDYIDVLNRGSQQPFHSELMEKEFYKLAVDSVCLDSSQGKRNLILIIAESMENGFGENIPELSSLSKKYTNFSPDGKLGGGVDAVGSTCTTSSTVSKISGFPLLTNDYSKLFPKIPTIYDVMKEYGYVNYFLQGTSGKFGFGGKFLVDHGVDFFEDDDEIEKKGIAKYNNRITDKKIFDYAKEIVKQHENGEAPFSLTIATIETHFPYGLYDEECQEKPENSSDEALLKATVKCASRQIDEFVSFVLNGKLAEYTEIVILGDHLFKGKYIVQNYPSERSWLSIFINPAKKNNADLRRKFASIDMAPTILESLGFELPQHKMAFGTSLFSESATLLEKIGLDSLNHEFARLTTSYEYNNLILSRE